MSAVPPIAAASGIGEGAALHADGNVTRAFCIRELAKVIADQLRAPGGPLVQGGEAAAYPVMRPATLRGLAAKRTIRFEQERPGTTLHFKHSWLDEHLHGGRARALPS
jgi:hypothetical protein